MKEMEINATSWHCRLAKLGGHRYWRTTDICQYTRDFLWGSFLFLVMVVCIGVVSGSVMYLTGAFLYQAGASVFFWTNYFDEGGVSGIFLWAVFGFAAFCHHASRGEIGFINKLTDHLRRPRMRKEPGFLSVAYHAWKNKYCFKISTKEA